MRKCSKCEIDKPLTDFRIDSRRGSPRASCKQCDTQRHREWVKSNRDRVRAGDRSRWQTRDRWACHIRRNYGLEPADYDRMLSEQEGRCAICQSDSPGGRAKRFNVDHCHSSGKVRGLLCNPCNTAIGALQDSPENLIAAVRYLLGAQQAQAFIESYLEVMAAA